MKMAGNELVEVLNKNENTVFTQDDEVQYFGMHLIGHMNLKDEVKMEVIEFNSMPFLFKVRLSNQFSPFDRVSITRTIIMEEY